VSGEKYSPVYLGGRESNMGNDVNKIDHLTQTGMYRDIMMQPDCWEALLGRDLSEWRGVVKAARHGLLVGMGSSYYAGIAARTALMRSGAVWLPLTSDEALHYLPEQHPFETAVVISQSGESADTVEAARKLRADGLRVLSVTNDPNSSLAREGQLVLDLGCGEERGSSTKTYTATLLALLLAAFDDLTPLTFLPGAAARVLDSFPAEEACALLDADSQHFFLGTGPHLATAMEAAVICKEKLFLSAEASGAADFIHGPLEAIDERSIVWIFSTRDRLDDLMLPLARRVRKTGARVVVIGEGASAFSRPDIHPLWSYELAVEGPEEMGALLYALPVQLLVVHQTSRLGYPVDTFRRMIKVMTGYSYGLPPDTRAGEGKRPASDDVPEAH
jgi:glutamine---fructose-6-phosphate transaminase (isomerizing)